MLIIQTPLWCIDGMCSYLAQQLRMMCRLKQRFQIADMTLCQRSRTNILKICKIARNTNIFFIILTGGGGGGGVFKFVPMFAYHVLIATNVSEYIYDLEVRVQIQIYLKICLTALNTNSSFMH